MVFIATEVVLFWFLWKYDGSEQPQPVKFTHGSHRLEIVWTILPAATLLFIAIYQMNAWADVKMRKPDMPPTVEVTARQFEWRLRYPGHDGKLGTQDDMLHVNDLHVPVDEEILIDLKSKDVLHSFFLPNLRVKQDAVPGHEDPRLVPGQGDRHVRPGLRRAVRLGTLQDEGPADGREPRAISTAGWQSIYARASQR